MLSKRSKVKRRNKHGFLSRKKTKSGNKVIQNRRKKGRRRLAV